MPGPGRSQGAGRAPRDPMDEALGYLTRRSRTVSETRRHLSGKGHSRPVVDDVIERLRRMGYLDDVAYAARYAGWAATEKPMGRARLAAQLAARGLDRETIERGLASCFGEEEEARALQHALEQALRRSRGPLGDRERRRVAGQLLRRGFPAGRVYAALRGRAAADDMDESGDPDEGA
jgi:regulatory protein